MDIKGKTVLITGSTGKLARTIVQAFAESGANCIGIYNKNFQVAKELENIVQTNGVRGLFVSADIAARQGVEKVFAAIEKFDKPQILINAAAIFNKMPLDEIGDEYARQIFDVNFFASLWMTQKFVEMLKKTNISQKPVGKIINMIDATITRPPKKYCIYSASKAALASATVSLAKELAPDFTVNAVAPGLIHWQPGMTEEQKAKMLARIPAGRNGSPAEVVSAVKFLIENDYVTGRTITPDGGWML